MLTLHQKDTHRTDKLRPRSRPPILGPKTISTISVRPRRRPPMSAGRHLLVAALTKIRPSPSSRSVPRPKGGSQLTTAYTSLQAVPTPSSDLPSPIEVRLLARPIQRSFLIPSTVLPTPISALVIEEVPSRG